MDILDFREQFREDIVPSYRGPVHVAIVLSIAFGGMALALAHWGSLGVAEVPVLLVTLIVGNFTVYGLHRGFGHHLRRIARAFYKRHSKEHHRFFSPRWYSIESSRDLRIVFFPWPLTLLVSVGAAGIAQVVELCGLGVWSSAIYCGIVLYYLGYEGVHFCDHLPDGHPMTRAPFFRYMRLHHRAHHAAELMHRKNFNVVFPLADPIFGTLLSRADMREVVAREQAQDPERSSS
jgi:hypothetical protein